MANISDANGTITFKANNKEIIESLFTLTKLLDTGSDYSTYISEWEEVSIYESNDEYKYELVDNFGASGRWSYYCNIENMFIWIKQNVSYKDDNEKYLNLLESIKKEDWSIEFDYVDYEPGCEIFGNYNFYYVHKKDQDLDSLVPFEGECEGYELNIVNYARYLNCTLEEALEEWSYKCEPEELKEIVENEKEMMEEFENKSFDKIIKDSYILEELYKGAI